MIDEWTIYWILKLDDIICTLMVVCVLSGAVAIVPFVIWACDVGYGNESSKRMKSLFFTSFTIFVSLMILGTLLPSTKQLAMIKVIPAIANSEVVGEMSKDAKELYRLGIEAIKEQLTGGKEK